MRVRANEMEGVFLIDSRVGNLLGYVGLSLPGEYEKRIPHEAFKGRPRLEAVCRCSLPTLFAPVRERPVRGG